MKRKKIEIDYPIILKQATKFKQNLSMNENLTTLFYTLKAIEDNKNILEKLKNKIHFKRKEKEDSSTDRC